MTGTEGGGPLRSGAFGLSQDSRASAGRRRPGRGAAEGQPQVYTATYVTGSLPGTASACPSFTRRRRWASASETAIVREP